MQCTAFVIKEEYNGCSARTKQGQQSKNQQRLRQEKSSSWRGNRRHNSQDLENWLKVLIFNQVTAQLMVAQLSYVLLYAQSPDGQNPEDSGMKKRHKKRSRS